MLRQDRNTEYTKPAASGVDPRAILNWINRLEKEKIGIHSFQFRRYNSVIEEAADGPF